MRAQKIQTTTLIPGNLEEVFSFFSKAENLNSLTPPELSFSILSPLPIEMKTGQHIHYRIKLMGVPFFWKTEISVWDPPLRFVDRQLKGPYQTWIHEHRFRAVPEGTEMTDTITYLSKGWILAPFLHGLFVDKKVKEIFAYREKRLHEIFGKS